MTRRSATRVMPALSLGALVLSEGVWVSGQMGSGIMEQASQLMGQVSGPLRGQ